MTNPNSPRQIAEQNAAYRRGIVMGLTMAEAGILIIFVLLLLIGFNEWTRAVAVDAMTGKVAVEKIRLANLETAERRLAETLRAMDFREAATDEEIRLLVRVLREAAATPTGQSALREAKEALNEMRRIKDQMEKDGAGELAKTVERQAFRIANQEGQLKGPSVAVRESGTGQRGEAVLGSSLTARSSFCSMLSWPMTGFE